MPTASCVFAFALGLSGCVVQETTVQLRDPSEVGVNLLVEGRSVPVIAPGSYYAVLDPVPPTPPYEVAEPAVQVHVSRKASGALDVCCFRRGAPNLSENPIVLWRSIWWPISVPLGTGDALHAPFDYSNRLTIIRLEMVTPWSNVISVKSTQSFNRPLGATFTVFGALVGAMGAAVFVPETKSDTPHIYSASMIGLGSALVATGLVMLLTPSRETEWRAGVR